MSWILGIEALSMTLETLSGILERPLGGTRRTAAAQIAVPILGPVTGVIG